MVETWPTRLTNPPTAPVFSRAPGAINIEITGRCQLRCRHCFNESGPDRDQELALPVLESLLDEMSAWGVRTVRIGGGEPTCHRQFPELVAACARRGIRITLNSHGVYGKQLLQWLQTATIERFFISLDGLQANHEAIRGQGTFQRTVASCRALRAAGQNVTLNLHVSNANRQDLTGLVELAATLGADFKVSPLRPVGRALRELPGACILPAHYLAVVREVTRLRQAYPHIRLFTDFDILDAVGSCALQPGLAACKAGRIMVNIGYTGDVYPCAFFVTPDRRFSAGNIHHDLLAAIWTHSPVFEPFRVQRKSAACQTCRHYQRTCAGGCAALAYFASGAIDTLDPTCFAHLVEDSQQSSP